MRPSLLSPILSLVVGVVWLASGLSLAGRFAARLELYSHFQPSLLVACVALSIAGFALRLRRVGVVSLLMALILGWSTAQYLVPPAALTPEPGPSSIRLVWANLQNWSTSSEALDAVLEDAQADIVVLTELSALHVKAVERARARWPHQTPFPRGSAFELLILSRWPLRELRVDLPFDERFPIVDALVCPPLDGWDGRCAAVVALHAVRPALPGGFIGVPPTRRDTMLRVATAAARQRIVENRPVVLMGDFNATPFSASFAGVVEGGGLVDSATQPAVRPHWTRPTWFSRWPGLGLPIDHILLSPDWRVHERRLGPYFGSDHRPLVIELSPIGRNR